MYSWPVGCGGGGEDLCSPLSEAGSGVKWGSQAMNVTALPHHTLTASAVHLRSVLRLEWSVFSKHSGRLSTL